MKLASTWSPLLFLAFFSSASLAAPRDDFFAQLKKLCGKSYAGQIVQHNKADESWLKEAKIMHVRDCSEQEIRIPLHVGENRSRTWIISRVAGGLRLKHDHRHKDGTPEKLTLYGGNSQDGADAMQQSFPADAETKDMFLKNDLKVATSNVWKLAIVPGKSFSYSLTREGRHFQINFDLSKEVPTPPAVW